MSRQHCRQCGQENPAEARFCMRCGFSLLDPPAPRPTPLLVEGKTEESVLYAPSPGQNTAPAGAAHEKSTDWAAIAAALLAFLGLRHMSRRARDTVLVLAFLTLFFGCPMVCGFMAFALQWFSNLFH